MLTRAKKREKGKGKRVGRLGRRKRALTKKSPWGGTSYGGEGNHPKGERRAEEEREAKEARNLYLIAPGHSGNIVLTS